MLFYTTQLIMALFAFLVGSKEVVYLEVVKELAPGNETEKPFHLWGFFAALLMGFVLSLYQTWWALMVLTLFQTGVLFWIVYELRINTAVFGRWNYVGNTASTDKTIRRLFPGNPETALVHIKAWLFMAGNLLYLLLKHPA